MARISGVLHQAGWVAQCDVLLQLITPPGSRTEDSARVEVEGRVVLHCEGAAAVVDVRVGREVDRTRSHAPVDLEHAAVVVRSPTDAGSIDPIGEIPCALPRNSKSAHQLIQNTETGMLIRGPGGGSAPSIRVPFSANTGQAGKPGPMKSGRQVQRYTPGPYEWHVASTEQAWACLHFMIQQLPSSIVAAGL